MKTKDKLLENYYRGETTIEEERLLKELILQEEYPSPEKDAFGWYQHEGTVPGDLEETLFEGIKSTEKMKRSRRIILYSLTSAAASVLLVVTLFLNIRAERIREMESRFFVMEQALFQMSESIQPQEEKEVMVLWVDENVEIIVN